MGRTKKAKDLDPKSRAKKVKGGGVRLGDGKTLKATLPSRGPAAEVSRLRKGQI